MRGRVPEDEQKRTRRDWMMGLIRELRLLTDQLRTAEPRTPEHNKLQQQWDDKLFEIVHQPFVWMAQQRQQQQPADFGAIARDLVDALDRLTEYKIARDHLGHRRYDEARRNAATRFVGFAHAIVMRMRHR